MLPLLGVTLFISAFLLFICEPMVGKMVLPIMGGSASVWTTCVLFFQTMLLGGYVYTHFLGKLKRLRDQILLHSALLLVALAFLPIHINALSGHPSDAPVSWLLGHLLISVGIPFAVVSATAPLLQYWLARTSSTSGRDPYFLYAISNAGSLLALLAYPVLIEPRWGVSGQSRFWFDGYGLLLALVAGSAMVLWRHSVDWRASNVEIADEPGVERPSWKTRGFWLVASFVPSALMLAVTNHISLNIGSVPFLWVIPLAVYLLTFIMAFARKIRLSTKTVSAIATVVLLLIFPIAAVTIPVRSSMIWALLGSHVAILFFGALLCHSALADRRPSTKYLTEFYFIVAFGGVLGGIFTAILAPAIFKTVFEYPLLVALVAFFRITPPQKQLVNWQDIAAVFLIVIMLAAAMYCLDWAKIDVTENLTAGAVTDSIFVLTALLFRKRMLRYGLIFAMLVINYAIALPRYLEGATRIYVARDFFGVKKVLFDPEDNTRKLLHGDTMHGLEALDPSMAGQPLSYYHETGPIGDLMEMVSHRPPQHVGVVGLGTGSIAAYGGPERHITFFDVDPQVVTIASTLFSFVRRCGNNCNIIVGDGRLSIQAQPDHEFDMLVFDAFNSDSIPAHLVSREAVRMYLSKLKPDGILVFHVSNRYLDVEKLATLVTADEGLIPFVRNDDDESPFGKSTSDYVAAVRRKEDFSAIRNPDDWDEAVKPTDIKPWTDDYSNMMSVLRWN